MNVYHHGDVRAEKRKQVFAVNLKVSTDLLLCKSMRVLLSPLFFDCLLGQCYCSGAYESVEST